MSIPRNAFSFVFMGALGLSAAVGASSFNFRPFYENNDLSFFNKVSDKGAKGVGFESAGEDGPAAVPLPPAAHWKAVAKTARLSPFDPPFLDNLPFTATAGAELGGRLTGSTAGLFPGGPDGKQPGAEVFSLPRPFGTYANDLARSTDRAAGGLAFGTSARGFGGGPGSGGSPGSGGGFAGTDPLFAAETSPLLLATEPSESPSLLQDDESEQNASLQPVPLPASGLMLIAVAMGLGVFARRKPKA